MANRPLLLNNFATTLAAGITAVQTTISLTSVTGLVSPSGLGGRPIRLTIVEPGGSVEIVTVASISGSNLTVVRGAEGTTARIWASGSPVEMRLTAGILEGTLTGLNSTGALVSANLLDIQTKRDAPTNIVQGAGGVAVGGNNTSGVDAVVVGYDGLADIGAVAIGKGAFAPGSGSITIGSRTSNPNYPHIVSGRDQTNSVSVRGTKRIAAQSLAHYYGYDYLHRFSDDHIYDDDSYATVAAAVRETTLTSPPFQLGDAGWPGPSVSVEHGDCIRVGSYTYMAWMWVGVYPNGGYYGAANTGTTEPTWGTSLYDWTYDGPDLSWICLGTSFEFAMPDYARFTPTSVGVIAKKSTPGGSVVYPQITAGPVGSITSWLGATTINKITGNMSNHFIDPISTVGAKNFVVDLSTAGTDLNCTAQFVIKGYVIEADVA